MHFVNYHNKLEAAIRRGTSTEHTHRPALKSLLENAFEGITATNEPKPDAYGAVDFTVSRRETDIGRIETKKVGEDLGKIERSGQMKRYLMGYKNLILTDYLEFRWYVRGELRQKARLGSSSKDGPIQIALGGEQEVQELLTRFVQYQIPSIKSSKELAMRMAFFARIMCNVILYAFDDEKKSFTRRRLHEQLKAFSNILLFEPTPEQFADLYAQTVCYGMFASRMRQTSTEREPNTKNPASGLFPLALTGFQGDNVKALQHGQNHL